MEINNIQPAAVENLARTEQVQREPQPRPERIEPETNRQSADAVQVDISAEARARQQADQAALEKLIQGQAAQATYNASGEIGG